MSEGASPRVTIVVATHDRRASLLRMLDSLRNEAKTGAGFEVVVVADGCGDGTVAALRALSPPFPVRVIEQPRQGPAAARNHGLQAALGEFVLFLDDDVIAVPGLVRGHLDAHQRSPGSVVIGPMLPPGGASLPPWLEWEAITLEKQYRAIRQGAYAPTARQFYTANASVGTAPALAVGGFDETLGRAEDVELGHRLADAGLTFRFVPEAAVIHLPDRTFDAWLEVAYSYGRNAVRFERELGRPHLAAAYEEWSERHPLNRLAARLGVGSPLAARLATALTRHLARVPAAGPLGVRRLQLAACAAAYSIRYWQGVAEATGLGTRIWTRGRIAGG